jgi:hypothetical protein
VRLRLAAGRYSQAPPLDALSPVSGDPTLGRTVSDQAALGVEWAVAGRWEVGVEGWGKAVDDAVVEAPGEAPVAVNGAAYGVELTSRYRLRERFFSWVSLTMGRAIRGGAPFDSDQPFAVNAVASWDFLPEWNAGVRYRIASGLPYTPIDDGLYDGTTDTYLPVEGAENSARLPNYQKLDVHLERTLRFRRWKAVPYLEAWWVPPTGNVLYPAWSYDYSQEAYVEGPSFLPLLGVRVEI